jgi:signal transduction histidine kinase
VDGANLLAAFRLRHGVRMRKREFYINLDFDVSLRPGGGGDKRGLAARLARDLTPAFLLAGGRDDRLFTPPEMFVNKTVSEVLPAEAAQVIMQAITDAGETGLHRGATFPLELHLGLRWFELTVAVRRGAATRGGRFVTLARDFTERKQAEQALLEASCGKDEFLALLGHELRNPLAPIRNAVQVLAHQESLPDRVEWAVELIGRQSEQLEQLVDDLLDVARISIGRLPLRLSAVAMQDVVGNAVQSVSPLMEERGHRLEVRMHEVPIVVMADAVRLTQILTNLLNNAAKYTPEGGEVLIDLDQEDRSVVVRVRDNGRGILPEDLPRPFNVFSRGRTEGFGSGELEGLGVGLPLAKQLTEKHGGTLEGRSGGPGQGREFVVTLPLDLATEASTSQIEARRSASVDPRVRRVLIVDDNPDVAESFKVLLEVLGHEVKALSDGRRALDVVREWQPHAVFLDIAMPNMDGFEVVAAIRASDLPHRPLLTCSSSDLI